MSPVSSVVNYSVTLVPDASADSGDFFCVKAEELTYGKKIKDSLFPWYDLPVRLSLVSLSMRVSP